MKIEEAIKLVKEVTGMSLDWDDAHYDALQMAIKALEQEPCEDAVSRKAVLNTLNRMDSVLDENRTVEAYKELLTACYKDLPSVTPTTCIAKVTFCKDDLQELVDEKVEELAQHMERRWIPVSEKLPNDRDWYLGIFKEPDTGWINPLPFICDYVGRETKATTKEFWILRGFTDRDYKECDYYYNLECVAWMPLPEPYKAEMEKS